MNEHRRRRLRIFDCEAVDHPFDWERVVRERGAAQCLGRDQSVAYCEYCDFPCLPGDEVIFPAWGGKFSCCDDCLYEIEDSERSRAAEDWESGVSDYPPGYECAGHYYSSLDPHNAYSPDGRRIGSLCGCEDYPCCGH